MPNRLITALCVLLCAVAAAAVAHIAGQPIDYLRKHLVVDDAIYYLQPARHWLDGLGYSFDGVHRTNGVQPLWAMVITALVYLLRDPDAVLRAMVLVSGGCWVAGGWLLFTLLRPMHAAAGAVALLLWLMAGLELRLTLMGMENGLHGLLLALALVLAQRLATVGGDDPQWNRRAATFGLVAALLALTRIEYGLLAALWWLWVVWRRRGTAPLGPRLLGTWPYLVPVLVLGGLWLGFSRVYFGEWTPISGAVKAWNVQENGTGAPFLVSVQDNLRQTALLSLSGIALVLYEHLVPWLQRLPSPTEWAIGLGICFLPLLPRLAALGRPWPAGAGPRLVLGGFLLVHLALVSLLLAPYTGYCTWYFTGEILFVSVFLGSVVGGLRGWWRWLLAAPLLGLVVAAAAIRMPMWFATPPTGVTAPYVELGRWAEHWLPPRATVGCFASGYISLEAPSHRVVNLDGLINDGRYLRDYVMKHRIPDYFRDERIGYFADNLPVGQWQRYWKGEASALPAGPRPLHAWLSAPGEVAAVLATADDARAPAHPLGAVLFRALALGEVRTIGAAEVAGLGVDLEIVGSYLQPLTGELRHVVLPRAEVGAAVDLAGVQWLRTQTAEFAGQLELLGWEVEPAPVPRGGQALLRVYLRAGAGIAADAAYEVGLRIGAGAAGASLFELVQPFAHGTQPAGSWKAGELRSHTFLVRLPADFVPGNHVLAIGARRVGGEWLRPAGTVGEVAAPVPVGVVRVGR